MTRTKQNTPKVGDKWYRYLGLVDSAWEFDKLTLQTWVVDAVRTDGLLWMQSEDDPVGKYRKLVDPGLEQEWVCRTKEQALQDFVYRRTRERKVVEEQFERLTATLHAAHHLKESWDAERAERGAN